MKKIILMGIPHHGNLGDNAIAIAEETLIKKYLSKYSCIQLPENNLIEHVIDIRDEIKDEDIILLHGGGNIGDTYKVPEEGRRYIIKNFLNNKIIIFPQTAFFDSEEELEISKQIYNNHKNLIIMAREEKSYNFMKKEFENCKIYLTPDIVMFMKKSLNLKREDILFLFRQDKERVISNQEQERIKEIVNNKFGSYIDTDMHLGEDVIDMEGQKREDELNKKIMQFNKAKFVITDRLHGMIFSAITETPCVVMESYTHKIKESYKWLKDLEYIELCDDINDIENKILKVLNSNNKKYDNKFAENIISNILINEIALDKS